MELPDEKKKSQDNVTLFPKSRIPCHSLLSSTVLRGVEAWKSVTRQDVVTLFPIHEPLAILYLVL